MPGNLPFFKFDADAWLTGKVQLFGCVEKGIYADLLARIWHENGAIKNDVILPRLIRVEKATLSDALQAFFDIGIMYEKDGFLRVKFIDEQLSARTAFIEQQREFGRSGGRPKKGTKPKKKEERRNIKKVLSDDNTKESGLSLPPDFLDGLELEEPERPKSFKLWSLGDLHQAVGNFSEYSDIADDFIDYWSEQTPSGKMRLHLEKAWDTKRRLRTWADRNRQMPPGSRNRPRERRPGI